MYVKQNKHIKVLVQKHELQDFPYDKLKFSNKWITLLNDEDYYDRYPFWDKKQFSEMAEETN